MEKRNDRLAWWREARFGMMIHWGIYAVPAGVWEGKEVPGLGEWIMHNANIPIPEYEKPAARFNPVKFDAAEWVRIAKDAGMRYIVITAKHHDGFAMFDSPSSSYDIVDATPFGKDPMKALACECRKAGLRLCFYYSQSQDWHAPGGAKSMALTEGGNTGAFNNYLEKTVKPHLRELLTRYGPIGLIWFDTPAGMTVQQSIHLKRFVHRLQPDCLVSGRIGNGVGDYGSMGDNQIVSGTVGGDWESPVTINHTWGFRRNDRDWKPVPVLLSSLGELASRGCNCLLNVGPTAAGVIPAASVQRLRGMGRWMKTNGEAVYGTKASPFPYGFSWGWITRKPGRMYLIFSEWPKGRFCISGIRNEVRSVRYLRGNRDVPFLQEHDSRLHRHLLKMTLSGRPPEPVLPVVVVEIKDVADVETEPREQWGGLIHLPAVLAQLHVPSSGRTMRIGRSGITENWHTKNNWMSWTFRVERPGEFDVKVATAFEKSWRWRGGHLVSVRIGRTKLVCPVEAHEESRTPQARHLSEAVSRAGRIRFEKPGLLRLDLKAVRILKDPSGEMPVLHHRNGLCVSSVNLSRVR